MSETTETSGGREARRTFLLIFGMPALLAVVYYGWLTVVVMNSRFTIQQMDWNGDGHTSVGEFFQTADVIERPVQREGHACIELVWTRKGTVLRVECPAAPG